jgi:hypothetical protein
MSILGEIVSELIGEAVVETFQKNRKPRPPFPEGESNASLGAAAAFGGVLSLIFGLMAFLELLYIETYRDIGRWPLLGFAVGALVTAWFSRAGGRRAPTVTTRNLGLARFGAGVATLALAVSGVALILWIVRIVQWH